MQDGSSFAPIEGQRSVGFTFARSSRWGYRVHAHGCFEMIWIAGGYGHTLVGDHAGTFAPGDCFLLGPGLPHSFYTDGFLPNGEVLEMRILWFLPALVAPQRAQEFAALVPVLERSRRGLVLHKAVTAPIGERLLGGKDAEGAIAIEVAYAAIFAYVQAAADVPALSGAESSGPFRTAELERLERVRQILRQRYQLPLSLEAVATQAGLSPSAVNLLLRKYTRSSFLETLTAIRLDQARRLLRDAEDDISVVAQEAGFGSLATFNRRFRAAEEMSPQEYRARHRA